jgi:hypothetical protein
MNGIVSRKNGDRKAVFSSDMVHRYELHIDWDVGFGDDRGKLNFIMLNPSTADENKNDPTVTQCENRAKRMGFSGLVVTNLFALRSTDPKGLYKHPDPVGVHNNLYITDNARGTSMIILGWGAHGQYEDRAKEVLGMLAGVPVIRDKLYLLDRTKGGFPKHPLYISKATNPTRLFELVE